jgi:hypothetical protein
MLVGSIYGFSCKNSKIINEKSYHNLQVPKLTLRKRRLLFYPSSCKKLPN